MEKHFKIICLVALVLLVITLPAAAIPSVIGSGVGSIDHGTQKLLESKDAWKISDGDKTIAGFETNRETTLRVVPPAGHGE